METNQVRPSEISTFLPPQSSPRQKKSWDRRPEEKRENHVERLNSGVVRLSQRLAERLPQKTDQQIPRCHYYEITSGTPRKSQNIKEYMKERGWGDYPKVPSVAYLPTPIQQDLPQYNLQQNLAEVPPTPHPMFLPPGLDWGHTLYISLVPSVPLISLHASPSQSAGPIRPSLLSSSPACSVHKRLRRKENHMLCSHQEIETI